MGGRGLPPERVQAVLGYLAAGLNPNQAAREAGVSKTAAYELDREVTGVPRLAASGRRARRGRGLPGERVRLVLDQLASLTS